MCVCVCVCKIRTQTYRGLLSLEVDAAKRSQRTSKKNTLLHKSECNISWACFMNWRRVKIQHGRHGSDILQPMSSRLTSHPVTHARPNCHLLSRHPIMYELPMCRGRKCWLRKILLRHFLDPWNDGVLDLDSTLCRDRGDILLTAGSHREHGCQGSILKHLMLATWGTKILQLGQRLTPPL
jgi:hypothetical protein